MVAFKRRTRGQLARMSNRSRARSNRPRNQASPSGRMVNVNPDPVAINSMASFTTNVETSVSVASGEWSQFNIATIVSTITSRFGIPASAYALCVESAKVWLLSAGQSLTVQFLDPLTSGVLQDTTDWGTPVRFAAVGFRYPENVRSTSWPAAGGTLTGPLLAINHSLSENARVLMRFTVSLRVKSLAGE